MGALDLIRRPPSAQAETPGLSDLASASTGRGVSATDWSRPDDELDDTGDEPGERDDRRHDQHQHELIQQREDQPQEDRRVAPAEAEEERTETRFALCRR